jgi:hypothetical protein
LDIARSLQLRDGFPLEKGIDLWMHHMTDAVRHTAGSATLFVGYDDFVDRPGAELERIAAFVGGITPGTDNSKARAHGVVNDSLRHHRTALADLFASPDTSHTASVFYSALKALSALQRAGALQGEELESLGALLGRHSQRAHTDERVARRLKIDVTDLSQALSVRSAERDSLERRLQATSASLAAEQAARLAARQSADSELTAVRGAAEEERARLAGEITRLNALVEHLQTPIGALKLVLRALLPRSAHAVLRRAACRLFPGWWHG